MYPSLMKLRDYINQYPRNERAAVREKLAETVGCSVSSIKHYAAGIRNCKPGRAAKIEQATGGNVSRDELLFPDESVAA